MTGSLGVQITPWSSSAALVELGRKLGTVVDTVWVQDQMLARNVYALLGALAQAGCGVGTNVTYPIGRNPIEMASAAATISELVPEGREMVVGMGTGGALVNSLFTKDRPVTVVREAMELMRALWAGERVELDRFPVLGGTLNYKPGNEDSGKVKVTVLMPLDWSRPFTLFQLDSSAQAPWAKTTVTAFAFICASSCAVVPQ